MSDITISQRPSVASRSFVSMPELIAPAPTRRLQSLQRCTQRGDWRAVQYSWRWMSAGAAGALAVGQALSSGQWPLAVAAAGAVALSGAYAMLVEPAAPVLDRLELSFANLPPRLHGLRVMQLSDLHLGSRYSRNNLCLGVEMIKRERPDLVVFTGDFVSEPEPIADLAELLDGISAPLGCYAVLGNHDYWEGPQEIVEVLGRVGVETLINENRRLCWNDSNFWLIGVDEPWSGSPNLGAALRGVPDGDFKLLLAHAPEAADEAAERGIDLQLSGHTHGGHLNLPLLGAFALPRHGWRYEIGLERINQTQIYTNRGLGGMALRLNCPPEVTLLTLLSEQI